MYKKTLIAFAIGGLFLSACEADDKPNSKTETSARTDAAAVKPPAVTAIPTPQKDAKPTTSTLPSKDTAQENLQQVLQELKAIENENARLQNELDKASKENEQLNQTIEKLETTPKAK